MSYLTLPAVFCQEGRKTVFQNIALRKRLWLHCRGNREKHKLSQLTSAETGWATASPFSDWHHCGCPSSLLYRRDALLQLMGNVCTVKLAPWASLPEIMQYTGLNCMHYAILPVPVLLEVHSNQRTEKSKFILGKKKRFTKAEVPLPRIHTSCWRLSAVPLRWHKGNCPEETHNYLGTADLHLLRN